MTHSTVKKLKKPRARRDVAYTYVYHFATIALLCVTLFFTFFAFRGVFLRTLEALIDVVTSAAYFVLEGFEATEGLVKPTVTEIPKGLQRIFPMSYENFVEGLRESCRAFIDRDNFLDFLIVVVKFVMTVVNFVLLVGMPLIIYACFLNKKAKMGGKIQKKTSRFYRFLLCSEECFFGPIKYFFKRWDRQYFRRYARRKLLLVLWWFFNLNFFIGIICVVSYCINAVANTRKFNDICVTGDEGKRVV